MVRVPEAILSVGTSAFRMDGLPEIGAVLGDLAWLSPVITIRTQSGREISTRPLQADLTNGRLIFERGVNADDEHALSASRVNHFISAIRGVPVEFQSGAPRKMKFKGRLAFEVPFPTALYYMQRRRHSRAQVSPDAGYFGRLPLGARGEVRMNIVDISLSGVRLCHRVTNAWLALGTELPDVTLDFGDLGQVSVDLGVVGRHPMTLDDSGACHYGFAFLELAPKTESTLQRLVASIELDYHRAQYA